MTRWDNDYRLAAQVLVSLGKGVGGKFDLSIAVIRIQADVFIIFPADENHAVLVARPVEGAAVGKNPARTLPHLQQVDGSPD